VQQTIGNWKNTEKSNVNTHKRAHNDLEELKTSTLRIHNKHSRSSDQRSRSQRDVTRAKMY